jgi:hypothetical protein
MRDDDSELEQRITEFVTMKEDGSLEIGYLIVEPGISPGHSLWTSKPGCPDFIEFGTRHGVTKPGQTSTIRKELRNGEWREWQEKEGDWN